MCHSHLDHRLLARETEARLARLPGPRPAKDAAEAPTGALAAIRAVIRAAVAAAVARAGALRPAAGLKTGAEAGR